MKTIKIVDNIVGMVFEYGDCTIEKALEIAQMHIEDYYHSNATIRLDGDTIYVEGLGIR